MGVADLRKAFNEVSQPRYTCQKALSGYEAVEAGQVQVLAFSGIGPDGNSFEVRSEQFNPNLDPVLIARKTAQALLDKQEPLT
jgi:hypothetical protein